MKNTDWLYKLPRNSSRAAGDALKILCELSKPADEPDSLSAFLGKIVRINQRTTEGWLDGQLNHKRGRFTKEHFRVITTYFARESKVLTCGDEINAFARLFGEDFVLELSKDWAIELQLGYKRSRELPDKSDSRYPQISSPIERNFLTLIINKIETHSTPLIVILGKPGIGKTTLLRQIMNHQRIKNLFEEKILTAFLEDGAPYVYYPIWFETVWPNNYSMLNRKMDDQDYAKFIRSRLQSEKYLLLIDDVSSAKYAKELLLADLSQSSTTIITTSNKEIAKELRRCYDCEFVEIPPFSINEVEELYFRASGEIFHSEERPLVDELRHLLQGNPLGLLLSFPELRKLSLPEYVKLLNLDDTIIPLELEKEVFLPLQIAYDHMNGQVKEWFLDIARLPFLHSYDQNFLGLSFGKENQQGDLITRKIIEKINDVTTAFERVSNDHQGWKINHQVWLFAKSISKRECEDHELLEKASHNSFYKNTFINLPNSSVIETIKFDLGINRPEELKSTTNLFQSFIDFFKSPGYLTDWNIITQNKANLTSQEYVYAYYIHNNEYRQRFGYYLGFLYPGTLILFASLVYLLTIFHAIHLTEHYVWIFVFLQKTLLIFLPAFLIGSAIINIHDQIQWNKLFFIITDRMK